MVNSFLERSKCIEAHWPSNHKAIAFPAHSCSRATINYFIIIINNFGKSLLQLYHVLKLVQSRITTCYLTTHENTSFLSRMLYTCQLFLRYKREIFILRVMGFLKTTRSFPKIPEEVRSLPKTSKVFQRRPKSAEGEVIEKTLIHKIRDREEGIVIYSFYTWLSFLTWV